MHALVGRIGWACAFARSSHHSLYLIDGEWLPIDVNDSVAIRADRAHISNRIHLMFAANLGELLEVVNVDEPFSNSIVCPSKVKTAHVACRSKVSETLFPRLWVPLVRVDPDSTNGSFEKSFGLIYFIGKYSARLKSLACLNDAFHPCLIICLSSGTIGDGVITLVTQSPTDIPMKQLSRN